MLTFQYQRVIFIAAGLWFTVLTSFCPAEDVRVPAKSKALAHYIMAVVHDLNGNREQAVSEYEKSSKFDAQQPAPHLRLAAYYARLGRINEATKELKTVIKLQPESAQAHYLLALIYSSQKKYELAADQYESILKIVDSKNPGNVDIHAYLAQIYFATRRFSQAQEQLGKILQFQPKNVSALYLQGSICLETNLNEKAKENFRRILGIEPQHDGALNSLAYIYAEEEINLDEALKMSRKAVELDPANGAYQDTLGWVLYKKGFYAESLMALEKAQTLVNDATVYDHIGDVYLAMKEPALARKFWLKSLALQPKQTLISQKIEQLNRASAHNQNLKNPTR